MGIIVISVLIMIVTLVIGVPVPFSFGASVLYLIGALGISPDFLIPSGYNKMANLVLICIPLFIITGGIMRKGKLGDVLVGFVEQFIGHFKSGLGSVTVVTCAIFGSISGSASATLSCVGSIMQPKLEEKGYPCGVTAALIASACVLDLLIPPSAAQVLYAWAGGQSVLACFLSTVGPGILLMVLLCIVQHFMVKNCPDIKVAAKPKKGELLKGFGGRTKKAVPALLMPIIILGGIYGGVMTPMEAAAVAALYCIPVGFFIYRGLTMKELKSTLIETGAETGAVMIMLMSAMLFSRILVLQRVPDLLLNLLMNISSNKIVILMMLNVMMVIVGMLMDDGSGIMLCTPILLPIVTKLGISPIQFAAIMGVNLGMGLVTPPCAPMLYFASRVGKSPVKEMLKPTMMFIIFAWIPTLILTTLVPEISLTLPRLILGKSF